MRRLMLAAGTLIVLFFLFGALLYGPAIIKNYKEILTQDRSQTMKMLAEEELTNGNRDN